MFIHPTNIYKRPLHIFIVRPFVVSYNIFLAECLYIAPPRGTCFSFIHWSNMLNILFERERERERERDAHTGSEAHSSAELFNNYTFESSFVVEPRSLDGLVGWRRLVGKVYSTHHSSTKTSIVCCFSLYCCCSKEKGKKVVICTYNIYSCTRKHVDNQPLPSPTLCFSVCPTLCIVSI